MNADLVKLTLKQLRQLHYRMFTQGIKSRIVLGSHLDSWKESGWKPVAFNKDRSKTYRYLCLREETSTSH